MEAQIEVGQEMAGMVEVIRWVDGMPESWTVPTDSLPTVLQLLKFDENGCLWSRVDIAA